MAKTVVAPLKDRLLRASLATSCTCQTKSPDTKRHEQVCHYRLFWEALCEIERLDGTTLLLLCEIERLDGATS